MGDGEESSGPELQALEHDLRELSLKLEELLEENTSVDESHRLPVTEFTVTPRRVAALHDQLLQQENGVVREVERERLLRLLQCHHLKASAWDNLEVKSRSLFCISSDVSVKNYPIETPRPEEWRKVISAVKARLKEVRGEAGGKKTKSQGSVDGAPSDEDFTLELTEAEYKELLYRQLELTCREKVEKELVLIKFMMHRLKDAFNARFEAAHQRKGRVIEEVHRLTKRERQLKSELVSMRQSANTNSGIRPPVSPRNLTKSEVEDEAEYDPTWMPEERPELLLFVEDTEVSEDGTVSEAPTTARLASSSEDASTPTTQSPASVGSDVTWAEARAAFLSGPVASEGSAKGPEDRRALQLQKPRQEWTWAEARAWREWRTAEEEEQRRRRAHATTLTLQLERIKPTIKSLLQEFDGQVKALVDSRVATDEALLIYELVSSRLQMRLFRQEELEAKLASLQDQRCQMENQIVQLAEEEENTRREEARAKAKQERLQEQLKEEETALRRTIINLPIEQYNHLLALYNKRTPPSSKYLDLPSARGHHGGGAGEGGPPSAAAPLSPTGGGPLSPAGGISPAQSEAGAAGRRGSTRPSRPTSGASHTDDLRSEDQMPEGLAGGARTWRQFLRYRRRRQDLLEEAEEATTKRATATSHLHSLDAHRNTVKQELSQLEATVAEISQELRLVDEDTELVLILHSGQVKMDLEGMTESIRPDFQGTRLLQGGELLRLNAMAEKYRETREEDEDDEDTAEKDEELESLRTLKGQLELQVELAQQELHQINTFKVGRDVITAAVDVVGGGEQQDSTQLYGSLQRLQQLHGSQAEKLSKSSTSLEKQIRKSRKRVGDLQRQADELAREIDDLQLQVTQAQPEVHVANRENRLRRVMLCSDLTSQTRKRQATILDLEHELDTLRLRTFPMLSRPPPPTL